MRILVSTQYYWPEAFVINDLTKLLTDRGHVVTVLTGKPNYPQGNIYSGYRAWGVTREQHQGVEVVRVPLVARGQQSRLRLALNYLSFLAAAATLGPWALRKHTFDIILVYGVSPLLQALPAVLLAKMHKVPLVVWVQDLWPESLSATGYMRNRWALKLISSVVRIIYRASDRVLVPSEAFRTPVEHYASPDRIFYYPNAYVDQPVGEASFGAQTLAQRLERVFSVVFAGNLGSAQALDTVINAAATLAHRKDIAFFLVGSGSEAERVRGEIERLGLLNIVLCGRFAPEDMGAILPAAGCLLVTLKAEPIFSYTIPSKVQAYLAAGRPIIAALDGEGARIIEQAGAGLTVAAENAPALARAIEKMADTPEVVRNAMGKSGRSYYEQHFTADELADALVAHLGAARQQARQ
ncbi:glycosyltransferase family 4 protein [Devosia beringensis]|uniref:glycosyltransferase family 4 protein n=1 Tax=Devosia beringensis TaxID=2657486 RepID=UPI00186BA5D4|nr:glycosyltransferase family 4 protein [Devosia beringensis]